MEPKIKKPGRVLTDLLEKFDVARGVIDYVLFETVDLSGADYKFFKEAVIGKVKDIINDKKNVIKFTASVPVKGTCVNRACPSEVTAINGTEKIFVYLKAKGSGKSRKVYIQTSFPKVDCACPK